MARLDEEEREEIRLLTSLDTKMTTVCEKVSKIHECLYGNGDPQRAITDRVSVLERQSKTRDRLYSWIILILVTLAGLKEVLGRLL